ncbi:MAG: DNA methyltransferase, partial [Chloroflexota bacterium]
MEYLLVRASQPGMMVLDPMVGSGIPAWVAKRLGCRCVGYDINKDYLRLAGQLIAQEAQELGESHKISPSSRQAELIERWQSKESSPLLGIWPKKPTVDAGNWVGWLEQCNRSEVRMLGERGPQCGLFAADNLYADFVGSNSFYGF